MSEEHYKANFIMGHKARTNAPLMSEEQKKASLTVGMEKARTNSPAFYAPEGMIARFSFLRTMQPAPGYPGYWCAMGEIKDGSIPRQLESLVLFKYPIHSIEQVAPNNRDNPISPTRVVAVLGSTPNYCKVALAVSIEEFFEASKCSIPTPGAA